jgi:hypothetical protein
MLESVDAEGSINDKGNCRKRFKARNEDVARAFRVATIGLRVDFESRVPSEERATEAEYMQ